MLSNTIWPRAWHERIFERDGVLDLVDGDVYTSEIPWTKPSPHAFAKAMEAVGATDPARCVYVGDRLFDDVWGAHNAGLRAVHLPHSAIPPEQIGHTEGEPDAVVQSLDEIPGLVRTGTDLRKDAPTRLKPVRPGANTPPGTTFARTCNADLCRKRCLAIRDGCAA